MILTEMLELVQAQTEAVIAGDPEALLQGANRHEELLTLLETAEIDRPAEELRELSRRIEQEKEKLQSLLAFESGRVDFMLRVILSGPAAKGLGYPGSNMKEAGGPRMINRRA